MRVHLLVPCDTIDGPKPAGHIIDHKDAHWLVRMGIAAEVNEHEAPRGAGQVVTEAPPAAEGTADDD